MNKLYVTTNIGYKSFTGMPQEVVEELLSTLVSSYAFITKEEYDIAIAAQQ